MKNYIKPEIKELDLSLINSIAAMNVSANAVNFNNVETDTWDEWASLFGE